MFLNCPDMSTRPAQAITHWSYSDWLLCGRLPCEMMSKTGFWLKKTRPMPNIISIFTQEGRKVISGNRKQWGKSRDHVPAHVKIRPLEGWDVCSSRAAQREWLFPLQSGHRRASWADFYSMSTVRAAVMIHSHILYLGSHQGVKPLDCFIVRYEAVHPIHIQHDLTESWREKERDRKKRGLVNHLHNCPSHLSWAVPERH